MARPVNMRPVPAGVRAVNYQAEAVLTLPLRGHSRDKVVTHAEVAQR